MCSCVRTVCTSARVGVRVGTASIEPGAGYPSPGEFRVQGVHMCETIVNFQNRPVPPNCCCHVLALSGGLVVGWQWGSGTGYRALWADSFL